MFKKFLKARHEGNGEVLPKHPREASTMSQSPVEYMKSAPTCPSQRNVSFGPAVEYAASTPSIDFRPAPQNAPARQPPYYPPYSRLEWPSTINPQVGINAAELPAQPPQIYPPQGKITI